MSCESSSSFVGDVDNSVFSGALIENREDVRLATIRHMLAWTFVAL